MSMSQASAHDIATVGKVPMRASLERVWRSLLSTLKFRRIIRAARRSELADSPLFTRRMSAELALNRFIFDPDDD